MNHIKRIVSLLLALALVLGALGGMAPAVRAEGYEATDSYVLNFSNQDIAGYEDYDNKRLYASPYRTDIYVTEGGSLANWNWCSGSVLNMINTTKLDQPGEGAWASIGVYCVDAVTDGVPGYAYRRVNLEDSGYFSDSTAGRLRSIILASFPHQTDMEALAAQVNAWDDKNGNKYAEVQELNYAEAISATQSVIWTLTNEGSLGDPVYAGYAPGGFDDEQIVYPESMDFAESAWTAGNINALAAYLNALAPTAARDSVVTDAAFSGTAVEYAEAGDGTYTATVTTTVTANVDDGDDLVLTAVCGELVSEGQEVLDGTHTYTVTFEGLASAADALTVNIDGTQDASDVFLFDPMNGRDASQSMAGYDSSSLPVHAEATAAPRVLNLTKVGKVTTVTTDEEGNETTKEESVFLENISFEIYFVTDMESYVSGDVVLAKAPEVTESEIAEYITGQTPIATITTDENGYASYNFTLNGQPDGIYIVRELHNEYTEAPMDPFYIAVPMTAEDGTVQTTLDISPKNDVIEEDVEINKDVNEIGNDHDTHDVGQIHTWIIRSSIPAGMKDGLRYEITDTLNYQLTYVGNVRVTVAEKTALADDEQVELVLDTDYTLEVTPGTELVDGAEEEITSFKVALTKAGMEKAAAFDRESYEVRVCFDAYIDEDAILDSEIPNQAHISYENNVGLDFDEDSDQPEVHTGAAQILKVDASDETNVLAGAVFRVYRPAAESDDAGTIEYIEVDGISTAVVQAAFHDNAALEGDKVYDLVTGTDGRGGLWGLAYGTYYLVETQAPEGYHLLTEPAVLTIAGGTAAEEVELTVVNSSAFRLPETGGIGTTVFTFGGMGIIAAGILLLATGKKKRMTE